MPGWLQVIIDLAKEVLPLLSNLFRRKKPPKVPVIIVPEKRAVKSIEKNGRDSWIVKTNRPAARRKNGK